mgnify:CR=1 FL=1
MDNLVVETRYGKVQGTKEGGVCVWRGIPYAKPPVGKLRFQAPQPPDPWAGVRDATRFGPNCVQFGNYLRTEHMGSREFSEDCLYLNIWSPAADGRKRPVMVWIHGGFFRMGSGSLAMYNGVSFAEKGDVVLVTINYRLGALGFLQLGEFGERFADSGNCGLLDQIAALRWVKENIEAFGGDPDRVTIFGQSAGGRSTGILLAAPEARGLFSQAIVHSGGIETYGDAANAGKLARQIMSNLNIGPQEVDKLLEVPVEKLVEATPPPRAGNGMEPNIDGIHLTQKPLEALAEGHGKNLRIMIGYCLNDFTKDFEPRWKEMSEQEILDDFKSRIGTGWEELLDYYLSRDPQDAPLVEKLVPMLIYNEFTYPAIRLVEIQEKQGAPAWLYRFDWLNPLTGYATHALELPFVFNNLHQPGVSGVMVGGGDERLPLAEFMHRSWIAFAHNGDPSVEGELGWPAYRSDERAMMLFNTTSRIAYDLNPEERKVWERAKGSLA